MAGELSGIYEKAGTAQKRKNQIAKPMELTGITAVSPGRLFSVQADFSFHVAASSGFW